MALNVYECMFIFDSNAYARDPGGFSGRVAKMVEKCGGELLASRLWNELKLAYPIKSHRKGTYWLTYFRLESTRLVEFNRACRLEDDILRHLALKVDPRLVETLVAHARGEVVRKPVAAVVEVAAEEEADTEQGGDDEVA